MSDLEFVTDENETTDATPPKQEKVVKNRIPPEYIPVKLSSMGKLDAPATLHVRDYSGEDVVALALARNDNFLRVLIDTLNNVVYEGFDCSYLHEYELEEIMLNITGNFWSPVIRNYPYPYTEGEWAELSDERKKNIKDGRENLQIDISLSQLETVPITPKFEEPITITNEKGESVSFRLPRIKDYFAAEDYLEAKYRDELEKFTSLEAIYKIENESEQKLKLTTIDPILIKEYKEFNERRTVQYIKTKQAQLVVKHGSKKLQTIDEQIKEYPHISAKFWRQFNQVLEDQLVFGVNHDVKMISPISHEPVIRRCYFRPLDYVPNDDLPDNREYSVLFG